MATKSKKTISNTISKRALQIKKRVVKGAKGAYNEAVLTGERLNNLRKRYNATRKDIKKRHRKFHGRGVNELKKLVPESWWFEP